MCIVVLSWVMTLMDPSKLGLCFAQLLMHILFKIVIWPSNFVLSSKSFFSFYLFCQIFQLKNFEIFFSEFFYKKIKFALKFFFPKNYSNFCVKKWPKKLSPKKKKNTAHNHICMYQNKDEDFVGYLVILLSTGCVTPWPCPFTLLLKKGS